MSRSPKSPAQPALIVRGRYLEPPYAITRAGARVRVNGVDVFHAEPGGRLRSDEPAPAGSATRLLEDFARWLQEEGGASARRQLTAELDANPEIVGHEFVGEHTVWVRRRDADAMELILPREGDIGPPSETDRARRFAEMLEGSLASGLTVLGHGYLFHVPASEAALVDRVVRRARSPRGNAEREVLKLLGQSAAIRPEPRR